MSHWQSFNLLHITTIALFSLLSSQAAGSPTLPARFCPLPCYNGEPKLRPINFTYDVNLLRLCHLPMLLEMNTLKINDARDVGTSVSACSTTHKSRMIARDDTCNERPPCGVPFTYNTTSHFNIVRNDKANTSNNTANVEALRIIQYELARKNTTCNDTVSLTMVGGSVVGVYSGASVPLRPFADRVLERLIAHIHGQGAADGVYVESCNHAPNMTSFTMGIAIGNFMTLPLVQSALSTWSHGGCMTTNSTTNTQATKWHSFNLPLPITRQPVPPIRFARPRRPLQQGSPLYRRDDCSTRQVKAGDSCGSLASECGISAADFTKFNSDPSLCSALTPGQHVCCSSGSMPDFKPQPQNDGTCATFTVASGDTCSGIAASKSITVTDIGEWNSKTWQFMGCDSIQAGQVLCISTGDPPMPISVKNAVCGPQVTGTEKPANMSVAGALASLNPCPLNVCCNIWGQCGNTAEFCTESTSSTGAPGTAAPGENGCISNCGTDIVSTEAPARPISVGYFEAFNVDRPCLNMDASQIPVNAYSHLHFAFGGISSSFEVELQGSTADQWNQFLALSGLKRIMSFGGWAFSNGPNTYEVLRDGVKDANRATFAGNLASFITKSGADGIDIDWEYPGATDIPGTPPGGPEDGSNYLAFLKELRNALPDDKSISIAAPASYWYLKAFPIAEMSAIVDYIVYMTYDLHGQWDYGNNFTDLGCLNCLRSDVNSTETHTALSMITKAGVPSNKIVVGVTSYGRSFEMTASGCTGPMCMFTGPKSGAIPGKCTQTAGYLAQAEISQILEEDDSAHTYYDAASQSDILVYNDTQWVSYMSDNTKIARSATYLSWNFLGTVDWAIDLADFTEEETETMEPYPDCRDANNYLSVDDVLSDVDTIPDFCMNMYLMNALSVTMTTSLKKYADIMDDGYSGKYNAYARLVRSQGYWAWDKLCSGEQDKYFTCLQTIDGNNKTVACNGTPSGSAYFYVIKDETKFCDDLDKEYSLDCDWIKWTSNKYHDAGSGGIACVKYGTCPEDGTIHYPTLNEDFPVYDPGALIAKSLQNYTGFSTWLEDSAYAAQYYLFPPLDGDAVDGSSTMVFSVQSAVDAMDQVADVGEKAEEAQRKAMIIAFVTAFLLVIPGIGEAVDGVAALLAVARHQTC